MASIARTGRTRTRVRRFSSGRGRSLHTRRSARSYTHRAHRLIRARKPGQTHSLQTSDATHRSSTRLATEFKTHDDLYAAFGGHTVHNKQRVTVHNAEAPREINPGAKQPITNNSKTSRPRLSRRLTQLVTGMTTFLGLEAVANAAVENAPAIGNAVSSGSTMLAISATAVLGMSWVGKSIKGKSNSSEGNGKKTFSDKSEAHYPRWGNSQAKKLAEALHDELKKQGDLESKSAQVDRYIEVIREMYEKTSDDHVRLAIDTALNVIKFDLVNEANRPKASFDVVQATSKKLKAIIKVVTEGGLIGEIRLERYIADDLAPARQGTLVEALVNHDIGYGPDLSVRPHQEKTVERVKERLISLNDKIKRGEAITPEDLSGIVVMPVGGGKTRTMVASFAAAIEVGLDNFSRGDKIIVLNHTNAIHGQNLKVAELLGEYFKKKFGRELKVTEYKEMSKKAENKGLTGDVIVVSIPTVNNLARRNKFKKALDSELKKEGKKGKIAMTAIDEVHHVDMGGEKTKGSWKELIATLRDISPNFYQIGFTATPTNGSSSKGNHRIIEITEQELMKARVTPRTYVVKVEGVAIPTLKNNPGERKTKKELLEDSILSHPRRNRKIYEALDSLGIRQEKKSPSGRDQLEGVLGFAVDLRHAAMMALAYQKYFGRSGGGLRGRKLTVIGEHRGQITEQKLEATLQDYRKRDGTGETDGIVAVVSGETNPNVRKKILEAVEKGEIEAVINVQVWSEGADLHMFTHLFGAPNFSMTQVIQQRGRGNRRGPNDVTPDGELINDKPKIIFDVRDTYGVKTDSYKRPDKGSDKQLIYYGAIMRLLGYESTTTGQIYDAFLGRVVKKIDRYGIGIKPDQASAVVAIPDSVPAPMPPPPAVSTRPSGTQMFF